MAGSVHVVGASGAGETLVALLADFSTELGLSQVTFHKRSVTPHDRPRLKALQDKGAILTVDKATRPSLDALALEAGPDAGVALANAHVVVDCTPLAEKNRETLYAGLQSTKGFIALDAPPSFGAPVCHGVGPLKRHGERFVRVLDGAAQGMATIVHALSNNGKNAVEDAAFVVLRRGPDVALGADAFPSPTARAPDDGEFGTVAAREAHEVLHSAGVLCGLHACDVDVNTQLFDVVQFRVKLKEPIAVGEAQRRLAAQARVATTDATSPNPVFGFARDHGRLGRLFNALVVSRPTLRVHRNTEVLGVAFVPHEGTVVYSALAEVLWFLEPEQAARLLDTLKPWIFSEV